MVLAGYLCALGVDALYTEANYTAPIGETFSLAFHAGYAWGDAWDDIEAVIDYAVQANYIAGKFTIFGKFTGTDASGCRRSPTTSTTTSRASSSVS